MTCRIRFPRFVLSTALCAASFLLATALFAQETAPGGTAKSFAGTWHWMFQGKPFATMILEPKGDGFIGSVSHADLQADDQGKITDASAGSGISPIIKSSMENGVLLIFTNDGDDENEWQVTLTSPTTAEIRIAGDGAPRLEAIHAEKAQ